jgi:hypothetical protein
MPTAPRVDKNRRFPGFPTKNRPPLIVAHRFARRRVYSKCLVQGNILSAG